jgi:hypothetical protein
MINIYSKNEKGIWKDRTFDLSNPVDMVRYAARVPYTFPGGYEVLLIMDDGILCNDCIKENYKGILFETKNNWNCGWTAARITTSAEFEETEQCDNCSKNIN